jgi:hypothetical protein
VGLVRKQEVRGVDYLKMEKNRMEMESLESKMLVATQSIDTTTSEIIRLRESELFPQLLELVAGSVQHYRPFITLLSTICIQYLLVSHHMYLYFLLYLSSFTCLHELDGVARLGCMHGPQ